MDKEMMKHAFATQWSKCQLKLKEARETKNERQWAVYSGKVDVIITLLIEMGLSKTEVLELATEYSKVELEREAI